ncbi:hypothetical protein [Amycolatopsis speibonae]|uniref:Lycopene cyclase domain-containing protein n=1 Tax=Amycolatopsis speibonae TaxID=1450224 RepID=A0ABV7NZ88_9PSEU
MSPLVYTSIEAIPRVLLLVVGMLGLILSIKGRSRGVSGLMVGAFAVMLFSTVISIVWQFVVLDLPSWAGGLTADEIRLIFMGVGIPLDLITALSWLLVAIGVVKSRRNPGPAGYPVTAQPGFPPPQSGYAQPGYAQPNPQAQQPPS